MKYIKLTIVLVALVAAAVAQAPNKTNPERPNLSESFAKTGLRALLAIGDSKGTGSLTGPAKNALEDARGMANSASAPETLMIGNLLDFAIMRSTDNLARENIGLRLEKAQKDPELQATLNAINKRESECLATLEKAFSQSECDPVAGDVLKVALRAPLQISPKESPRRSALHFGFSSPLR
jgi:hypothetical protein